MKTTTTLLISMVIGSVTASSQPNFGITAGATFANITSKFEDESESTDYKPGFTTGVFANFPMSKNFSFEPALNFTQKGSKSSEEGFSSKATLNYLEMPLNFNYSFQPNQGFFIGAGPSVAFGLSGKSKWEENGESGSDDIKFGSEDEDDIKSIDLGANFQAGYKMKNGLLFSAGYNMGLNDVMNWDDSYGEASMKNNYFFFKLGWTFQKKTK